MRTLNLVEIQSYNDGRSAIPAGLGYVINDETAADDMATAEAAYYAKCAVAAKSNVDIHTVMLLDNVGDVVDGCRKTFCHGQPEPEEEE